MADLSATARPTLTQVRDEATGAHRRGEIDRARQLYSVYLAAVPTDAAIWSNYGALLRRESQYDLAVRAQRRALELDPKGLGVRTNLANVLNDVGHHEEALALRRDALPERPDDPELKAMIGKSLRSLGRYEEGIAGLESALAAHPDYAELKVQLALTELAAGHYAAGFRHFGARWETGELTARNLTAPQWDGGPLDGRTILVLPEQGFGDAMAFLRFLPLLREHGPGRVLLSSERPMMRLLTEFVGTDEVVQGIPATGYDVWTNIMDLPALHFAKTGTIPPPARMSVPEDSRVRARGLTHAYRGKLKVGVVWTGSVTYRGNAFRSFSHTEFHRLLDLPGVQLFSLYKGPKLAEFQQDGSSAFIIDAGGSDRDFGDCAAMMEEMDLIVTSDTVTAHLAGSLGRPVWTLLHWDAFWLWQLERERTPWYPTMRLIRQTVPRDWTSVFDEVRQGLGAILDGRARP